MGGGDVFVDGGGCDPVSVGGGGDWVSVGANGAIPAQELLYFVLDDNFKDYENGADSEARARACELYRRLGPGFAATQPTQSQTRQALVQSIRSATAKCDLNAK